MVIRTHERRPDVIRVLIAAGDPQLVGDIQLYLAESFPIEVVGTVPTGRECLGRLKDLRPNVLLLAEGISDIPALQISKQVTLTSPGVATVIISPQDNAEYLHKAFAAGARGVISLPLARERLITSIAQAYEFEKGRAAARPEVSRDTTARMITIYSAKGGVGKSLIASNLAVVLAQGRPASKVVLLDLNLQFGAINLLLDLQPSRSIYDLLRVVEDLSATAIENVLSRKRYGDRYELFVMPAPLEPSQADEFTGRHISSILAALKRYYDFIVVDTTSTISDVTLAALQMAEHVILVCTPDVLSISQTRSALEYLRLLGIPGDALGIVLNQVARHGEIKPEDVKRLFDYPVLAEIPSDYLTLQPYINSGTVLAEAPRPLAFVDSIRHLATQLMPIPEVKRKAPSRKRFGRGR